MTKSNLPKKILPDPREDIGAAEQILESAQTRSHSYRLAYDDSEFLLQNELRSVRLQLEFLKPELLQEENNIQSTVVVFGSSRIPDKKTAAKSLRKAEALAEASPSDSDLARKVKIAQSILAKSRYYDEARELGRIITNESQQNTRCELVVITGGGPGIMEAANRGADDANGKSIGLNVVLPTEQCPNPYVTPELSFQFHYFAIRKMHFLMRARALVTFPGGFGTLDELFDTLTLIQTKKVDPVPVLLFGKEYWQRIIDFEAMVDEGTINQEELDLFQYVETAEEAWDIIKTSYFK